MVATAPAPAAAQASSQEIRSALNSADSSSKEVRDFYRARDYRPLWIQEDALSPAAERFLEIIETAEIDGLNAEDYNPRSLRSALERAEGGSPKALARAEMLLSRAFASYVRDITRPHQLEMVYVDRDLAPSPATPRMALETAAEADSLEYYVNSMGWMNPVYAQLRRAAEKNPVSPRQEELVRLNLERARAIPANPGSKFIVVDAAGARLWMFENGRVRDTMRVVVGKVSEPTPMMAGLIRFAMVNPYWNIPPDLVRKRIAPNVLKSGVGYLRSKGYQALSDWSEDAEILDPKDIDWDAVLEGREEVRVRQLPGGDNAMGKMKFMFPNDLGIYLHDTPEKHLLTETSRQFSSGCVRVEDAQRLGRWLFGKPLAIKSKTPEQRMDLPAPVPVFITYLTAAPEGERIAFRQDVYNRDNAQLARLGGLSSASR